MGLSDTYLVRAATRRVRRSWGRVRRTVRNLTSSSELPPVLANSFPKSGTHLLDQVLSVLPDIVDLEGFIASVPSRPHRRRAVAGVAREIRLLAPGELARAHIEWSDAVRAALAEQRVFMAFIHRDLRDVLLSEVHYLTHMNRWHELHGVVASLDDHRDRLALAIRGLPDSDEYPDIGIRFARYAGWLRDDLAHPVRFSDLLGPDRQSTLVALFSAYVDHSGRSDLAPEELARAAQDAIRPSESLTYREKDGGARERLLPPDLEQEAWERVADACGPEVAW